MMKNNPPRSRTLSLLPFIGLALLLGVSACAPQPTAAPTVTLPAPVTATSSAPPPETASPQPSSTPTVSPYRSGFPDPGGYTWSPVASGFDQPVDIQNAGDGSGRLFVVEKPGRIRILANWLTLPDPFLDLRGRVGAVGLEQGLLGLAFHPNFEQNGYFYVNYTDLNGNTVIARFQVSADDPNRADRQSELILLRVNQPFANHNGGGLAFGPDGYLYIGLGDGGAAGDPAGNARNPQTLLGKMMRIDVDGGQPYAIPASNPFAGGGGLPEIWAIGLRNPWRFSFDARTGDLYIADVGQNEWEEVNVVPTAPQGLLNFGWDAFEGLHPYEQPLPEGPTIQPVAEYSHAEGCSVTGGYVYRGVELPEWEGVYFFGDYCNGGVFGLIRTGADSWDWQRLFETGAQVSTFGADEAGELYLADFASGLILRLMRR
jgi:glucose/arabinose dehydrogenase